MPASLVLSPTRTYAPVMVDLFKPGRDPLCMASSTAAEEAKPRCCTSPTRTCTSSRTTCSTPPPLFRLIQEYSGTDWREMYQVYNMGHRMEVYTTPEHAAEVMAAAERHGVAAQVVGRVEARTEKRRD